MKQLTLFICLFFSSLSFSQVSSGLVLGGGGGRIVGAEFNLFANQQGSSNLKGTGVIDYKFNALVGYKFRIQPKQQQFFYDADINLMARGFEYDYKSDVILNSDSLFVGGRYSGNCQYFSLSINPTFNYKIIKGLNAGIGVEPTYYFYLNAPQKDMKFDIPVTARLAYNFRFLELAVGYKYGLCNVLTSDKFNSGKFSDWVVSMYIPF